MNIQQATQHILDGKPVRRAVWIVSCRLAVGSSVTFPDGRESKSLRFLFQVGGEQRNVLYMATTDDLLAEDWELAR